MFFANIFDTEVVDHEAESDGSGFVGEEAWDGGRLGVAGLAKWRTRASLAIS